MELNLETERRLFLVTIKQLYIWWLSSLIFSEKMQTNLSQYRATGINSLIMGFLQTLSFLRWFTCWMSAGMLHAWNRKWVCFLYTPPFFLSVFSDNRAIVRAWELDTKPSLFSFSGYNLKQRTDWRKQKNKVRRRWCSTGLEKSENCFLGVKEM